MASRIKRLRIFAGPNGSGKSTLYDFLVRTNYFNPYYHINPDFINHELNYVLNLGAWPISFLREELIRHLNESTYENFSDASLGDMVEIKEKKIYYVGENKSGFPYFAAAVSDFLRKKMLESNSSFSFETVFSHVSKVDFIRDAKISGYKIYLYFVATMDPIVNRERVKSRVLKGGHDVPDDKIIKRYYRTMNNLYEGVIMSDRVFFFDNSMDRKEGTFELFAEKRNNNLTISSTTTPKWFDDYLIKKL